MRAGLVVTGVLGLGTGLVFAAAALTATLFPNGTMVNGGWSGGWAKEGWGGGVVPVPMPAVEAPAIDGPAVEEDAARDGDEFTLPDQGFQALPGDVVVTDDNGVILEAVPEQ